MTNFLRKQFLRLTLYAARFRLEFLLLPFVYVSSLVLYAVRYVGVYRLTKSRSLFQKIGVFPIIDHYDDPLFQPNKLKGPLEADRALPGIDFNDAEQLDLLSKFNYNQEVAGLHREKPKELKFYYHNSEFEAGDVELLYSMIRHFKPTRVIEVGAGNSTLLIIAAVRKNKEENPSYCCEHIAIEPYEMPWLEQTGINVIRQLAENVEPSVFDQLKKNDILFIDSSHMIRPQGDIAFLYLKLLPSLAPGVLVHIHDVFTPKDYPYKWVINDVRLWNEQYLFEAFLTFNHSYKVLAALNYLKHHYPDQLKAKCPVLAEEFDDREPGSFWLLKL